MTVGIIIEQDIEYDKSNFSIPHFGEGNIAYWLKRGLAQFPDLPLKNCVSLSKLLKLYKLQFSHFVHEKNHTYLIVLHKLICSAYGL